ncbi:Hypothetical Protein FCC1311_068822 [Hondaea fermentalgiana]|uniref:Uncharacterized protein n=1 Tax=Hondaea fermentalgiana TaxID=2315210 RepID=A0A2R5GIE3_9STRA|nr:Hypothetical Protein FCC1311_068822 [Hondaea fermentalgiana]|eukprot:GBG30662.1 Hypothetical Protein FCC1311_068822 [Hondaea fermentalgiana]
MAWTSHVACENLYGAAPFSTRTFVKHFVCEIGWGILGFAFLPVLVLLLGRGGVISCGFWPGKLGCGQRNRGVFLSQVVSFVLIIPILMECIYMLTIETHVSESFDLNVDLFFIVVILIIRSAMIAVKYAFCAPNTLRALNRGEITGTRFTSLLIVAFSTRPGDAILFDQLAGSFKTITVRPITGFFLLRKKLPAGCMEALAEGYESARRAHSESLSCAADAHVPLTPSSPAGKYAFRPTVSSAPIKPSEAESICDGAVPQEREIPVQHLAFFLVQNVYRRVTARTTTIRPIYFALFHLVADAGMSIHQMYQADTITQWDKCVKASAVLLRFSFMAVMFNFLIAAITNLHRGAEVAKTLLGLLDGKMENAKSLCIRGSEGQIGTIRLDPYLASNIYAWGMLARVLSRFGAVFNLRFSLIFGVYLILWGIFCVVTFASFFLNFNWLDWHSSIIYGVDVLTVAVLVFKALMAAADTNFYIKTGYTRALETLRVRMDALRFHFQFPSMADIRLAKADAKCAANLSERAASSLQSGISEHDAMAETRISHAIIAIDIVLRQVAAHPPIEILGRVITSQSLQRSLAGVLSLFVLAWNFFRDNRMS